MLVIVERKWNCDYDWFRPTRSGRKQPLKKLLSLVNTKIIPLKTWLLKGKLNPSLYHLPIFPTISQNKNFELCRSRIFFSVSFVLVEIYHRCYNSIILEKDGHIVFLLKWRRHQVLLAPLWYHEIPSLLLGYFTIICSATRFQNHIT